MSTKKLSEILDVEVECPICFHKLKSKIILCICKLCYNKLKNVQSTEQILLIPLKSYLLKN